MEIEPAQSDSRKMELRSKNKKAENLIEKPALQSASKKIQKKRSKYQKIDDDLRLVLFEAVKKNGEKLKTVANRLKINYSSAKSIFFTFRKKGRICKKTQKNRKSKKSESEVSETAVDMKEEIDKTIQIKEESPSDVTMSPQVESPQVSENRPQTNNLTMHQPPANSQVLNLPAYLNCFKKATSILEKFKSVSENLLVESLEDKSAKDPALRAQMNMSMKAFIPSLKDLIGDLQALDTPQINQYHPGHHNFYRYDGFPRAMAYPNPALFAFHPFFALGNPTPTLEKLLQ